MFFGHNRVEQWTSRHENTIILHEISARIFLVKSDTPFCSVAGWCSQETSVKYIRNRKNVMNMNSTNIENGGFGLKLCGNECRSNHTSFRTGLDPKYSYKKFLKFTISEIAGKSEIRLSVRIFFVRSCTYLKCTGLTLSVHVH